MCLRSHSLFMFAFGLLTVLLNWHGLAHAYKTVIVRTPLGAVRGLDYGDFIAFKGLPYAEPAERFASPVAKRPWAEGKTLDATHFGDACIAAGGNAHTDKDPLESYGESENCLYANVWLPKNATKKLPVMVWIHGGGFIVRTGNFPGYWGDGFVTASEAQPAILVTFNYRLGVFGFYSAEDVGTNFGFQDQQLLLKWVQENIAAFGGDPSRVTLSGQSAGAMSVICHLASPGSRGLFHQAVSASPVGLHYRSPAENMAFVRTVAKAVGCNIAKNLTRCLRSRPALELKLADIVPEYLFHLLSPCHECDNVLPWLPVVDGKTLPQSPVEAIRSGLHNKLPTLISTVRNETLAFVPTLLRSVANNSLGYKLAMKVLFRDRAPAVEHHYAAASDTAQIKDKTLLAGWASTDALMTCYSRYLVKLLSSHAPAFLSTFMVAPHSSEMQVDHICVQGPPSGASCHAGDIAYFLPASARMTQRTGVGYKNDQEARFAQTYTAALVEFVYGERTGYIEYANSSDIGVFWDLGEHGKNVEYHKTHCDFLESIGFIDAPWGAAPSKKTQWSTVV